MAVRLDQFRKEQRRDFVRYSLPVPDEVGEQNHELLIVGRERQIRESLGESEFEVTIQPGVSEDEWVSEMSQEVGSSGQVAPREAFDDLTSWFKDPPPQ